MPDYDFFELTGVSLEEKNAPAVKAAITRKEKELGEAMSTSNQEKRREAEAQLKFLQGKRDEMFGSGAKFKPVFTAMVRARIELLKKRLDKRVNLEASMRSVRVITTGKLKELRNTTAVSGGLPLDEIKAVYVANGFTIEESPAPAKLPKFPTNIDNTYRELERLRERVRKDMAINPKRESADSVEDLYTFAAYISDDLASASGYRKYPASRLKSICEEYQRRYTMLPDTTIEKLAANIAGQAASHVFDSEEHRKSYDLYILYRSPKLQELFEYMRGLIDADKRDPEIAEGCIKRITDVFGDSDIALALYNSEARIINNPYVPTNPVFAVRCAHCQTVCEFHSVSEARRLNRCTNCGEKLYKQCPKGHYVLLNVDQCPDCGYSFPDKHAFTRFFTQAQAFFSSKNYTEARNMLSRAIAADPSESAKVSELERRINIAESEYNKPLEKLNELIRQLRFSEASSVAEALTASRPDVDISRQRTLIMRVLTECRRDFASVVSSPQNTKVNICLDILTRCIDFKPARDFLSQTPPLPCASLSTSVDDESTAISLTWKPSGEHGVKYTLVRKMGWYPASPNDGEILLIDSLDMSYRDKNIEAGESYSYSVFAKRSGLYSPPASASATVLSVVSGIRHTQSGNTLRLLWTQPKKCPGVRVVCQVGNNAPKVLAEAALSSITIDNVEFGKRYSFSLTAYYSGKTWKSRTVRYEVVPTPEIKPFTISAACVSDNVYRLSWSIIEGGADVQILSGDDVIGSARSESRSCQLRLQPDKYYVIRAAVSSGGKTLYSNNNVEISTFSACTVDDSRTEVTEAVSDFGVVTDNVFSYHKVVHISLAVSVRRRPDLKKFVYFVKTDGTWASESDVLSQSSALQTASADTVLNSGFVKIDVNAQAEESYNITLFAVYDAGGREIVSAPCRKTINRPLNANVFCSVSRPLFRNVQFKFRGEANRPVRRWPGFVVCVSSDGRPIVNYTDSNAVTVIDAAPLTSSHPSEYVEQVFDIPHRLPKGTRLYLFWKDLRPGENFVFRWDNGFNGSV